MSRALVSVVALCGSAAFAAPRGTVQEPRSATATVSSTVVHTTLDAYAAFDIDWWHDCGTCSGGDWGNASILHIDLSSPRLRNLVAAAEPPLIRVGGSEDNVVKYQLGGMGLAECQAPTPFRGKRTSLCMTEARMTEVLDFFNATRARFIWGVPYFTDDNGWNSSNVEALLRFIADKGHTPLGLELGEEMAPKPGTTEYNDLVSGYAKLRQLASAIWPQETPIIVGPSVGMADEVPSGAFVNHFIPDTIAAGSVQAVNMHSYNNDGGWPAPGFLKQTEVQATTMLDITRNASATTALWCGECGPHNGGGINGTTNTAVSSFWYLDALGKLARMGLAEFGRQALAGSHYGLLEETTHTPYPDYWLLWVWKQFMGPRVLDVVLDPATAGAGTLHAYAHCAPLGSATAGTATLAFINIDNASHALSIQGAGTGESLSMYTFSAPGGLTSREVSLNGVPMQLTGDILPELPSAQTVSGGGSVTIPPLSYGFVRLPGHVASCS